MVNCARSGSGCYSALLPVQEETEETHIVSGPHDGHYLMSMSKIIFWSELKISHLNDSTFYKTQDDKS